MPDQKHTNLLIRESSPYLLQHAHNPVDWFPWGDEAFDKAKKENKLVLVSIGYSACHWCHVMEHESFEDDAVAQAMNRNFICIKVDREERPDVDQVYMTAVQLMTGSGGWPLNCFALPDGRPVYGGTYFPKADWMKVLGSLSELFRNEPERVNQYAEELTEAVRKSDLLPGFSDKPVEESLLKQCVENWSKRFDHAEGGPKKAPKFPLPNNYQFLLRHSFFTKDESLRRQVRLTLEKMAFGGIYDQIGGGFARYSTDGEWKVPHFEKMLYDNAQLVSLYSEAYRLMKDPVCKQVVYETLEFVQRELTSPEGGFYSALDADSEGEEGKYYVWKKEELQNILGSDYPLFAAYFSVNEQGEWEDGKYILLRKKSDREIAERFSITEDELKARISQCKSTLLSVREKRIRPGLDNKVLTSWNALMVKGCLDAWQTFQEEKFLQQARRAAEYLLANVQAPDGGLLHARSINGFLEDYAFTIEAFLALYESTFESSWLLKAKSLADYAIAHFHDPASGLFYFTADSEAQLVARKKEIQDNVIPSSNSSLAKSLFYLSHHLDNRSYYVIAQQMLKQVQEELVKYGSAYSNWAMLAQHFVYPFYEAAIVGNFVDEKRKELQKAFIPNAIFAGSASDSSLPLLEGRFAEGKTLIYICRNRACNLPTEHTAEALEQLASGM